jgi:glycosyltransferase involved in cell wall biosynthesis
MRIEEAHRPLISVIVAVFNGTTTLQQCIDSVASQTYHDIELIVIDGGSTDGTVDILKANASKLAYWISEPDKGIYNAWNKALPHARGEWICFLGADDYFWTKDVLARMAGSLRILPFSVSVAYGQIMVLSQTGESLYPVGEPWEKVKERFLQIMCIPHQGVMHRYNLFRIHGGFDESFRIAGDHEFLLRELKSMDAFFIPEIIVTGMRQGGVSSTSKNLIVTLLEMRRAARMHGGSFVGGVWLMAMTRIYIRISLTRLVGQNITTKLFDNGRRLIRGD